MSSWPYSLDGIKTVLSELFGKSHEIALDEGHFLREARPSRLLLSSTELERLWSDSQLPLITAGAREKPTLLLAPTISTSTNRAISLAGPPTPQPTSRTLIPGLRFI